MRLWCYSECISAPGKLENQPDHGGNRTRDLWFASPMLCQLSYEVKLVRVCHISKLSLKELFHSSQKLTRKLAARTFIQSQYLKELAASLRTIDFCDEWKRGLGLSYTIPDSYRSDINFRCFPVLSAPKTFRI